MFYLRLDGVDHSQLPSTLIGKPAPQFDLPPLAGQNGTDGTQLPGFSHKSLTSGHVSMVNIFASWCAPCREEHEFLLQLAKDPVLRIKGLQLYGLAYKDKEANTKSFLASLGNPYDSIGVDAAGRTAIDFGVYGVPETFIIRGDGTIAYKFIGPLSAETLEKVLRPELNKALN